jgi:hypothetical protein
MESTRSLSAQAPRSPGATLEALIEDLFDYAGMYPPAALSFEEALQKSISFAAKATRPSIVHADLVLDVQNLTSLLSRIGGSDSPSPTSPSESPFAGRAIRVALLGIPLKRASHDGGLARGDRDPDFDALRSAYQLAKNLQILSYEVRLAPDILATTDVLKDTCRLLLEGMPDKRTVLAIEPDLSLPSWTAALESCASVISQLDSAFPRRLALKIRGAGSAGSGSTGIDKQRLVHVLRVVALMQLPLKATAGLHHPILEPSRYDNVHGFLNLAVALMLTLAHGEKIPDSALHACLSEEDPAAFTFGKTLRWRTWEISLEDIRAFRRLLPFSIGSCSLEEPDADLVRLFGT